MIELPILQQGVNGWTTKALQLTLRGWVPALGVDGIFGPATRDAVVEVQRLGGVAQDGVVGPVTWNLVLKGTVN
jgi:peptidoglycan hydrolase-like protein with peptidoglycan-binding domain